MKKQSKGTLNVPEEIRVVALTLLGYPDETPEPKRKREKNYQRALSQFCNHVVNSFKEHVQFVACL